MTFYEFEPQVIPGELDDNLSGILNNYAVDDSKSYNSFNPKIDISEDEKNIYLEAELPGVIGYLQFTIPTKWFDSTMNGVRINFGKIELIPWAITII